MKINPITASMLENVLNKDSESFTSDDMSLIETIYFTKAHNDGTQIYSLEELLQFPNLKNIVIESSFIVESDLEILRKLPHLSKLDFIKCILDINLDFSTLPLETLSIERCYIEETNFLRTLQSLKSLRIVFPYNEEQDINLNDLNCSETLESLWLEGCCLSNVTSLSNLKNIKNLNFMYTEMPQFSFVESMPKLETIFVEPRYASDNDLQKSPAKVYTSTAILAMDDEHGSKQLT